MSRLLPLLVALLIAGPAAAQPQQLPADRLAAIKAATVYVKVSAGPRQGSGSGFLVRTDKDAAYIATNDHVVMLDSPLGRTPAKVELVFHSGTKDEWAAAGSVVATDPDRDLALVRFKPTKPLPAPIPLASTVSPTETMPVYVCGFPFGGMLAAGDKNPEVSIGLAHVSSVRTDAAGQVATVQLNGALNPGNSGGPVLAADGQLVGVAVRAVRAAGIGEAVPGPMVADMMAGRIGRITLIQHRQEFADGAADIAVTVTDPFGRVKAVRGVVAPAPAEKTPAPADVFTLPNAVAGPMKLQRLWELRASATIRLPIGRHVWLQAEWTDADGKVRRGPAQWTEVLTPKEIAEEEEAARRIEAERAANAERAKGRPAPPPPKIEQERSPGSGGLDGVIGPRGTLLPPLATGPVAMLQPSQLADLLADPEPFVGKAGVVVDVTAEACDPVGTGDGPSLLAHDPDTGRRVTGIEFALDPAQASAVAAMKLKAKVLMRLSCKVTAGAQRRPWRVCEVQTLSLIDTAGRVVDGLARAGPPPKVPNVPTDGERVDTARLAANPTGWTAATPGRMAVQYTGHSNPPMNPTYTRLLPVGANEMAFEPADGGRLQFVEFFADTRLQDELVNASKKLGRPTRMPVELVFHFARTVEFVNPQKKRITMHFYAVTHMALLDAPSGRVVWEGSALPPVFPDPDADAGQPGVSQQLHDLTGRVSPVVLAAGGAVLLSAVGGVTLLLLRRPRRATAKKAAPRRPRDEDEDTP